jgi:hypothetical protein
MCIVLVLLLDRNQQRCAVTRLLHRWHCFSLGHCVWRSGVDRLTVYCLRPLRRGILQGLRESNNRFNQNAIVPLRSKRDR